MFYIMSDYTHHPNDCRNPRYYVNSDGEYKRRPCASRWCHDARCRQAWARKESAILLRSFRTLPPTHFVVLAGPFSESGDCRRAMARFFRQLRKRADLDYKWWIEPSSSGRPHAHVLLRTHAKVSRKKITRLWNAACGGAGTAYWKAVRSVTGSARYVTKRDLPCPPIPPHWTPPLSRQSRHFYAKTKAALWRETKDDWFTRLSE